jgi:predicted PurR-regulated permease PerM
MSRWISFIMLVAIVLVIGTLSYMVMSTFLLPMFLAILLVVIFRPLHRWFVERCRGRERVAAGLTTLTIMLIVLLPFSVFLYRAAGEALSMVGDLDQQELVMRLGKMRHRLALDLPSSLVLDDLNQMETLLKSLHSATPINEPAGKDGPPTLDAQRRKLIAQALTMIARLQHELIPAEGEALPEGISPEQLKSLPAELDRLKQKAHDLQIALPEKELPIEKGAGEIIADPPADDANYFHKLKDFELAFDHFRETLLGPPIVAWLKKQANPDAEQLHGLLAEVQAVAGPLALRAPQVVGGKLLEILLGLFVMIVSLYYFLADGPQMVAALMHLSPLDDKYEAQLLAEFGTLSRAVVLAMLLAAVAQGLLAGVGYYIAGFQSVFLLIVITTLFAMIPFVGAASVWGSCALWLLLYEDRTMAAALLAIYGTLVVSTVDNIIKPMVLHGRSNLHPLLALLSVLGGVKALGPIGIFVGPMVVAFLQTLLTMLRGELTALDPTATKAAK